MWNLHYIGNNTGKFWTLKFVNNNYTAKYYNVQFILVHNRIPQILAFISWPFNCGDKEPNKLLLWAVYW